MDDLKYYQKFRKFYVYRTEKYFYLICCPKDKKNCYIMTINRNNHNLEIKVSKKPSTFIQSLKTIKKEIIKDEPEMQDQKLSYVLSKYFLAKSYGIIGFPKFLDGHYIYMITKKEKICNYLGSQIYRVKEGKLEIILNQEKSCLYKMSSKKNAEIKYIEYFNFIDSKYMYFSYEVDITNPIQKIISFSKSKKKLDLNSRFIWNAHILNPFFKKPNISNEFILPIIYGFVESKKIKINLKEIEIGVISRRSIYNVGTRYIKRGMDFKGKVANEVESEIFFFENFLFGDRVKNVGSYVFYRGSVPLFWGHETSSLSPKPKIVLNLEKDEDFCLTRCHFEELIGRYGKNISILNLVKKSEKSTELKLGVEYKKFCDFYINNLKFSKNDINVSFKWFDFFQFYNNKEDNLLEKIQILSHSLNKKISFFFYNSYEGIKNEQKGIIRINCVDCLDRTNNTMACISGVLISQFLKLAELSNFSKYIEKKTSSVKNELLSIIFQIFGRNGDAIAKQYAGSEAFHKAQLYKVNGDWISVKHNITFIAVKRYFHNMLIDEEKQKSFYLFLGLFVPDEKNLEKNLWDGFLKDLRVFPCECVIGNKKFEVFGKIGFKERILKFDFKIRKIKNIGFKDLPIFIEEEENEVLEVFEEKKVLEKEVEKIESIVVEKEKVDRFNFEENFRKLEKKSESFEFFLSYINKTSFF